MKKKFIILALSVSALMICGCNKTVPVVPEESESVISESSPEPDTVYVSESEPTNEEKIEFEVSDPFNSRLKAFVQGEGSVNETLQIDNYDGTEAWFYLDVDMDKDGVDEKFVLVKKGPSNYSDNNIWADLWFYGKGFATQIDKDAEANEYFHEAEIYDYGTGKDVKVIINFQPSMVNQDGHVFSLRDNMIEYPYIPTGGKYFNDDGTIDIYFESYSVNSDGTGHASIPHRFQFLEDGWSSLVCVEIDEAKVKELSNYDIVDVYASVNPDAKNIKINRILYEEDDERIIASLEYNYKDDSDYSSYATVFISKVYFFIGENSSEWQFATYDGQY